MTHLQQALAAQATLADARVPDLLGEVVRATDSRARILESVLERHGWEEQAGVRVGAYQPIMPACGCRVGWKNYPCSRARMVAAGPERVRR